MRDIFVRLVVCGVQQFVVLGSRRRVSLLVRTLFWKYTLGVHYSLSVCVHVCAFSDQNTIIFGPVEPSEPKESVRERD